MTPTLHLTRARIKTGAAPAEVAAAMFPKGGDPGRAGASHRLVWTLFPPDLKERPFLYRSYEAPGEDGRLSMIVLSTMPPRTSHHVLEVETRPFAPALSAGRLLDFSLRANAVVCRKTENGRGRKHDIVMNAIAALPRGGRAQARRDAIMREGAAWLARQGQACGFSFDPATLQVEYNPGMTATGSPSRSQVMTFSCLDFSGRLKVEDPEVLMRSIAAGIGKAKGFGNGLLLVKSVRQ